MRANSIIPSPSKITVITENLITRGIALFFEPTIKQPTCPLGFSLTGVDGVKVVNSKELTYHYATTRANRPAISHKGLIGISLSTFSACLKMFLMVFRIILVPIHFCFIGMVGKIFASAGTVLFGIAPICLFGKFPAMPILFIPCLPAGFTRWINSIRSCAISVKFRDRLKYMAFATSLFHIFIVA